MVTWTNLIHFNKIAENPAAVSPAVPPGTKHLRWVVPIIAVLVAGAAMIFRPGNHLGRPQTIAPSPLHNEAARSLTPASAPPDVPKAEETHPETRTQNSAAPGQAKPPLSVSATKIEKSPTLGAPA